MRTDFAHLLHLLRIFSHHEPPARYFNSYRNLSFTGRGRLALEPSLLLVEPHRTRADGPGNSLRRYCRNDCGVGSRG
jgi:hypothetical protein